MQRTRKLAIAKAAVVLGAIPILLWAYEFGPNPGFVGIPSENGGATCATSGCHTGTANDPANKGSVSVNFPNGMIYTPGVTQQLSVTIQDPATTQQAYGFQLTARLAASPATMAGSLAYVDNNTLLMCANAGNLQNDFEAFCKSPVIQGCSVSGTTCPSGMTLQYIEHSYTGYLASLQAPHTPPLSYTYNFNWTPPATNVGNVTIYVAGNAGVGGAPNQNGDHIYTNKYTLTPAGANTPAISAAGVVNGASFQPGVVPNSWITIQGTNLSTVTDTWANAIVNGKLPTILDGVSVNVGSQSAYVYYISPTQINALAPNIGTGSVSVTVTNSNGTSAAATAVSSAVSPAFFAWPNNQPVATHSADSSGTPTAWAVKNGTFAGVTNTPAKPGEAIILWGTGFGPTNPAAPVGVQIPGSTIYYTANPVTVTINGTPAAVYATALSPGFAGLYQVVVTVPASMGNGDFPLIASINGASSPAMTLTVHN
jgi:uncharacterized protein (TIGR03437 family)